MKPKTKHPFLTYSLDFDLEIRKRFAQPLATESGEFPDIGMISARMTPMCYEAGLVSGHATDAPQFMSVAAETFIKEVLTQVFSRTRSNGPGEAGSAGFGIGTTWIQTYDYGKQLHKEEDLAQHGNLQRDKNGLLPIESKAASERGPLTMADLRLSLDLGDTGMSTFPIMTAGILHGYREGELENWNDYTYLTNRKPAGDPNDNVAVDFGSAAEVQDLSIGPADPMDVDSDIGWEGTGSADLNTLDNILDSCLAVSTSS